MAAPQPTPTPTDRKQTALKQASAQQIDALLEQSSALHGHLCPRQILGVRSALRAGQELGLDFPRRDKRVLVLVETDGCYADGVSVASGCWLGRRTMRLEDLGRVAATFVDTKLERAVRVRPKPSLRTYARAHLKEGEKRYAGYLRQYRQLPDELLLDWYPVTLKLDLGAIISRAGVRVVCEKCGEEIINEREVERSGQTLCQNCAGVGYYTPITPRP